MNGMATFRPLRSVAATLVTVIITCALATGARAQGSAVDAFNLAEKLREEGKWAEAMVAYQATVDNYPDCVEQAAWALYRIGGRQWEQGQQDAGIATIQKIYDKYPTSAIVTRGYYAYSMSIYLIVGKQDYQKALAVAKEALEKNHEMSGFPLEQTIHHLALAQMKTGDLPAAKETLVSHLPDCLSLLRDQAYWDLLTQIQVAQKDYDGALANARLAYALCNFDDKPLKDTVDLVRRIYIVRGEFQKGIQFITAQEDAQKPNPLKDVAIPPVTPEVKTKMAQKAAGNKELLTLVDIYCGEYQKALDDAIEYMAAATADDAVEALKGVARVFKANDLNVVRGNQLMNFARTGEGENPLATPTL